MWNMHITLPQSTAENTKGAVLTAPGAFAAVLSQASIYENNNISASCADFNGSEEDLAAEFSRNKSMI